MEFGLTVMELLWNAQTPHAAARNVLELLERESGPIDNDGLQLVAEKHRQVASALDALAGRRAHPESEPS